MGAGRAALMADRANVGRRRPWPLVVRLARPDDEPAVLDFATDTWHGWDYMPRAWPHWFNAPDGVLLVGVVGEPGGTGADGEALDPGAVVAVVRIAMPARGEAWWEGIRVDPRVRGMDVATDLQLAEFAWTVANGAHVVRYATGMDNEGSHRLGARGGLRLLVRLLGASSKPDDDDEPSGFQPEVIARLQGRRRQLLAALADAGAIATAAELDSIWTDISADPAFIDRARLYEPRPWALEELTRDKLRTHLERGEVLRMVKDSGATATAILTAEVPPAEECAHRLAVLVGDPHVAFQLAELARGSTDDPVRFRFADTSRLVEDARAEYLGAGWQLSDWAMHILARPIDDEHPAPAVDPATVVLEDPPVAVIRPPR
jgi:hypothetical protein